jgi:ADP-L-glycero-D-manno-heptose 6-epimerase
MIVITGGAGFIGSCLIAELNQRGIDDILVVDNLGTSLKWKNLVGKKFRDYVHKKTFRDNLLAGVYGAQIEAIYHLGACSSTTETNADYLYENNFSYSRDLAEYAWNRNIRFIYASSAATYGKGEAGYSDTGDYQALRPLNMYGYSKHLFDLWLLKNTVQSCSVGLKFFNVFGPNEYHKGDMASLVYKAYLQIKEKGFITLFKSAHPDYADGEFKRDFVYVNDVTPMLADLMKYGEITGIYNVGTGIPRSWNDLAHAIFTALGKEPNIQYSDMPQHIQKQYQYFTQADMTALQQTRVYRPSTTLEESVQDYVCTYLERDCAHR